MKKKHDLKLNTEVVSCLPVPCSWSSLRGQQASGKAESVRTGQQRSGKRSLRTVRVHSRRIRQPALSLQRQPRCSARQEEKQLQRRGGEKWKKKKTTTGTKRDRLTRGKANALIAPKRRPSEADSFILLAISQLFPRPLCWLHATSFFLSPDLPASPPSPAPNIPLILFLSSITPVHSSSPCSPPSLSMQTQALLSECL